MKSLYIFRSCMLSSLILRHVISPLPSWLKLRLNCFRLQLASFLCLFINCFFCFLELFFTFFPDTTTECCILSSELRCFYWKSVTICLSWPYSCLQFCVTSYDVVLSVALSGVLFTISDLEGEFHKILSRTSFPLLTALPKKGFIRSIVSVFYKIRFLLCAWHMGVMGGTWPTTHRAHSTEEVRTYNHQPEAWSCNEPHNVLIGQVR